MFQLCIKKFGIKLLIIMQNRIKIVIISNYAWTIYNFRLSLINSLINKGYEIYVITQFDGYEKYLINHGCNVQNLFISRKGINPFIDFITFLHIFLKLFFLKPNICLTFTIKPVIYTGFVSKILHIKNIAMITGLGTGFIRGGLLTRIVKILYKVGLPRFCNVFFQNPCDRQLFIEQNLVKPANCKLTPGSGIDLRDYIVENSVSEDSEFKFLLIARLVWDKGIREFIEASRLLKKEYLDIKFEIIGPSGVANRSAVPNSEIERWKREGIVNYIGEVDDVSKYIKNSSCVVLPSYREGTSRVLLEASALARPTIATNVPGCKEVVLDGTSGFLCKAKDVNDLYIKMKKMISLPSSVRTKMGINGRKHIESTYSHEIVCQIYHDAISKIIS